jgi:uncharacterized membrane protein
VSGRAVLGGLLAVVVVGFLSPIAGAVLLGLLVLGFFLLRPPESEATPGGEPAAVQALERRVGRLEQELADLRLLVAGAPAAPSRPAPAPSAAPRPQPPPAPPVVPPAPPRPSEPPSRPQPARPARELDLSKVLGALGLAWAGGIVTVLGIVFFFVLAVNRGWINAELRLAFGAAASVAVFSAGFWLRRRFGTTHAALAAVGAGIAGGYATLLAATALYEFVPEVWALVAAAGIAAAATVVAIAWSAELVAGLGLVGALLVPLMTLVEDGELTAVGTGFAAIVYAAAATVAFRERWSTLLLAALAAAYPQAAGLAAQSEATDWAVVGLTGVFWVLFVATAVVLQARSAGARLEPLGATVVLAAAALACGVSAHLFDGESWDVSREGIALGVVAAAHLALGAAFFRRVRDFSSLLWAIGLAVAAVAVAELLGGGWLALAWAGEAAVLAWLGEATRERRFQLSSVAYLALAVAYTLGHEAPLRDLLELSAHPAAGAPSVLAAAAAAAALAWFVRRTFERPAGEGPVAALLSDAVALVRSARVGYVWLAGTLVAYAASLGLLELSLWIAVDAREVRFDRGHVAVSALWAALGLALVETGMRRQRIALAVGGLAWTGAAVLKTAAFDESELAATPAAVAFLLVGAGALLAGFEYQRLRARGWGGLRPEAALAVVLSAGLGAAAVVQLADGTWNRVDVTGGALVLLALPYAALAAAVFRVPLLRDLATLLWAISLVVLGAALFLLLDGVWVVLALAAASALLSPLALAAREVRLQAAAALYLLVALAYTLALEAPPRDFFAAAEHPGDGVPALVAVAFAAVVFGLCARHELPAERAPFSWSQPITLAGLTGALRSWQPAYRSVALVGAGCLGLYALSLGILDAAERFSGASVATDFQRGHTAVSALWGVIGLALLTLGLLRGSRGLRLAGFALFGISLAKLFLYDLTTLSSLARALSFLAVGALLLLGGFFYQRLSEQLEDRGPPGPRPA